MSPTATMSSLRASLRLRWPEWSALALFAALVAYAIPFHEPWADEAQAWQLARSLSLYDLFRTYIRYEGTPGLWHFLLWILVKLHVSYAGMHWVCGAIAVGSTAILLFNSPFPRYIKLTLPFTFFLLFQYAIVARSYVLVPPLLFLTATWWRSRPILVAVALGLLANTSLHAAVISGGLAIVFLVERLKMGDTKDSQRRRSLVLCAVIALIFYAFALWTAWPPIDLMAHVTSVRGHSKDPVWVALAALLTPMCQPELLSAPFWLAIIVMLSSRRSLGLLLPILLMTVFTGAVYANFWHIGLLVPALVCILWVSWPDSGTRKSWQEAVGKMAIACMAGTQILWSAYAFRYDHYSAYSPDLAAARYLDPYVRLGDTIALTNLEDTPDHDAIAVGILPYFERSVFDNHPSPFYWWGRKNETEELFRNALPSHPQIIVVETQQLTPDFHLDSSNPTAMLLAKSGYAFTNSFCGSLPFRTQTKLTMCHLIFQYSGTESKEKQGEARLTPRSGRRKAGP